MQGVLLWDVIIVVGYVFTFLVKNPTATQHDFWNLFIFIWTFTTSILTSSTFTMLPGNKTNYYYICLGKIPSDYIGKPLTNHPLNALLLLSIVIHCFVVIRCKNYEHKHSNIANILCTNQNIMYNFVTITTSVVMLAILTIIAFPLYISSVMDLRLFQTYPNYLWMYFYHLYGPPTTAHLVALIYNLYKTPLCWTFIKREIANAFNFNQFQ